MSALPLQLAPGKSGNVEVRIAVPAEAEDGGQQASIIFSAAAADEGDLTIIGQVRVSVQANVIHPVRDAEFSFPRIVNSNEDAVFTLSGTNNGSFPARLEGKVLMEGLSVEDDLLQASTETLQTGEYADLQVDWTDTPLIGLRKVTVSLGAGAGAPVIETAYVLIFPWKAMVIVFAVALPALSLILAYRRKN